MKKSLRPWPENSKDLIDLYIFASHRAEYFKKLLIPLDLLYKGGPGLNDDQFETRYNLLKYIKYSEDQAYFCLTRARGILRCEAGDRSLDREYFKSHLNNFAIKTMRLIYTHKNKENNL